MFVVSLCLSDLTMGIYLVTMGTADVILRGHYLWQGDAWRHSVWCRMAGSLSLLSSEVSAFMICLITLDRFIVLRFPFSIKRFSGFSAFCACLSAWAVGLTLAVVPVLPWFSHWNFYSQTGICIPLPITRQDFLGKEYSFSIMIVLNFILFLLIAIGQGFVYWSIKSNSMSVSDTSSSKTQSLTIARRLITVVVSDFCCWFPIGALGLAAMSGHSVPGQVNLAMAILVLPLNSSLNPFLYTMNIFLERRRQKKEDKLILLIKNTKCQY